jgi:nucleotide-binding universal stress UspA family protein
MRIVLAAIDNGAAGRPVLAVAEAVAEVLGASVRAIHFPEDGQETARALAREAAIPLELLTDPPPEGILSRAERPGVVCLVAGRRRLPAPTGSIGHITRAVAAGTTKPVVIVPPETPVLFELRRVLVPLEGSPDTAVSLATTIGLVNASRIEVVVLNVCEVASLPLFMDQWHWWTDAWAREFLARYVPLPPEQVRLELRVGTPADEVLAVANEGSADMVALGWARDFSSGRALVVKAVLERSTVPVLLLPVSEPGPGRGNRRPRTRRPLRAHRTAPRPEPGKRKAPAR